MNKEDLRQQLKAARIAITAEEAEQKSLQITRRFMDRVDWAKVKSVHVYKSVENWREVDTRFLVDEARNRCPKFKIEQPSLNPTEPLPATKFDLIIVPVL